MPVNTVGMRNVLANAYAGAAPYMALYSTVPAGSAGTEISGGSPAYARKASNWGAAANSAAVASPAAFDVPSGATVAGIGFHSAATGGTYMDGVGVTSQAFASQGTYTVTATYTQS